MAEYLTSLVVKDFQGQDYTMGELLKKVTLVVNVDCKVGGDSNNECPELEALYLRYKEKGFEILAFPCDQFQLTSKSYCTSEEVKNDLVKRFNVTFPIMHKVNVNGENAHPLFIYLQKRLSGFAIDKVKWDFTKFLIVNGEPFKRYGPATSPHSIEGEIAIALNTPSLAASFDTPAVESSDLPQQLQQQQQTSIMPSQGLDESTRSIEGDSGLWRENTATSSLGDSSRIEESNPVAQDLWRKESTQEQVPDYDSLLKQREHTNWMGAQWRDDTIKEETEQRDMGVNPFAPPAMQQQEITSNPFERSVESLSTEGLGEVAGNPFAQENIPQSYSSSMPAKFDTTASSDLQQPLSRSNDQERVPVHMVIKEITIGTKDLKLDDDEDSEMRDNPSLWTSTMPKASDYGQQLGQSSTRGVHEPMPTQTGDWNDIQNTESQETLSQPHGKVSDLIKEFETGHAFDKQ